MRLVIRGRSEMRTSSLPSRSPPPASFTSTSESADFASAFRFLPLSNALLMADPSMTEFPAAPPTLSCAGVHLARFQALHIVSRSPRIQARNLVTLSPPDGEDVVVVDINRAAARLSAWARRVRCLVAGGEPGSVMFGDARWESASSS